MRGEGGGVAGSQPNEYRGCMHRRLINKKTWLSALSYAQSRISLIFCRSLGFLVPWSSSLTADLDLADFLCMHGEEADLFMKHMCCITL